VESDEYVVDASFAVTAFVRKDARGKAARQLLESVVVHAPYLIDAEVGSVLRRHERQQLVSEATAVVELRMLETLVDHRYAHCGWMAAQAWQLRHTVTFYDALYAVLAARLDIPLLTSDIRLTKAPGLPCRVELFD
jgi:predicted nucleic acid-binding protein